MHELVHDGVLHPKMELVAAYPTFYPHQEKSLHAAHAGSDLLASRAAS